MKTRVRSIKIIGEDGSEKYVSIRTDEGELKTHFLENLIESGVVVPDKNILTILLELLRERSKKKKNERIEPIIVSTVRRKHRNLAPEERFFPERLGIVPRIGFSERKNDFSRDEFDELRMEINERM